MKSIYFAIFFSLFSTFSLRAEDCKRDAFEMVQAITKATFSVPGKMFYLEGNEASHQIGVKISSGFEKRVQNGAVNGAIYKVSFITKQNPQTQLMDCYLNGVELLKLNEVKLAPPKKRGGNFFD